MRNLTAMFILGTANLILGACTPTEPTSTSETLTVVEARPVPVVGEGRMIPITTDKGTFDVFTKKVGDSPTMKVLLLHGGPGGTHEVFENFSDHLPDAGIEFYYYDQLGSYFSDQPNMDDLLTIDRFVDEVEQVRQALGLNADNFYLYGQSWGGVLGMEYALAHQDKLKGLIVSNMVSSIPAYNDYAHNVLMADMDPAVLARLEELEAAEAYEHPDYMGLLMEHHYVDHILRRPADQWPEPVMRAFPHLNPEVYIPMQGPSELGASGLLVDWNITDRLHEIAVPTLVMAASHDTMEPAFKRMMSERMQQARYVEMPNGGHFAQWDDTENYFPALIDFIQDVDAGRSIAE
jgi:proline iminopeptidase